jgi:hypothetical protein
VWARAQLCKLQKGCTRLAAASDKIYQLLAHDRWFSPGIPASSITKTGRHDIDEKGVKTPKINQSINHKYFNACIKRTSNPLIYYIRSSCFIYRYVICMYLHMLLSNMISVSNDVRVV